MSFKTSRLLEFGEFRADPQARLLLRNGEPVVIPPKAFDVLLALLESGGRPLSREELLSSVWGETIVEEANLTQAISVLRKTLGDEAQQSRYIVTLPRRGYQFGQPVRVIEDPVAGLAPEKMEGAARPAPVTSRKWVWAGLLLSAVLIGGTWWRGSRGEPAPPIRSIAVLPFVNLSGDASRDYFSDAITDALVTSLGQLHSLQVFSRSATRGYRNTKKPLPEIARELGADALVEGSVQAAGGRVRVTAQLVRGSTDTALWAKDFEFDLTDILKAQGELARTIAAGIRAEVTPEEAKRLDRARKISPKAQQLYLKGLEGLEHRNEPSLKQAIGELEQAVAEQPDFAEAYAQLAQGLLERAVFGALQFRDAEPRARAAAIKALELDPSNGNAHAALGHIHAFYDWDWTSAEREFRRAIELDPNSTYAHRAYGSMILEAQGRWEEAIAETRRAAQLDPASSFQASEYGRVLYRAKHYDEAIHQLKRALELDPQAAGVRTRLADVYQVTGRFDEALELVTQALALRVEDPEQSPKIAVIYASMGRREDALRLLRRIDQPGANPRLPIDLAVAYFKLGDRDRGFYWLTHMFDQRLLVLYLGVEPRLDFVRDDPRFQTLMARLNMPGRRQ